MTRDAEDLEGMETHQRPDYAEQMYEQADLARKRDKEDRAMAQEGGPQDRADDERDWLLQYEPDGQEEEERERYEGNRRQREDEETA